MKNAQPEEYQNGNSTPLKMTEKSHPENNKVHNWNLPERKNAHPGKYQNGN